MQQDAIHTFLQKLEESFQKGDFVKLTLSKSRSKKAELKNIFISPVKIKAGLVFNLVYHYSTRDITKNLTLEDTLSELRRALQEDFSHADMYVTGKNLKLLISKKGQAKLLTRHIEVPAPVEFAHNRSKGRIIQTHNNTWLRQLGVVNANYEVRHEMKDKFLQINRYVELLEPEIQMLNNTKQLQVADMGSGKGYLTFALYDFLLNKTGNHPFVQGIEFREDLVDTCNSVAREASFKNLSFKQGSIEESGLPELDVLIALHACDTATDDAIYRGITANASLIVVAPCCHKQIRKDWLPAEQLKGVTRHGILDERQAELVTDALRALIMESRGYKTKVFEFIATGHTPKNIAIVGRKINKSTREKEKAMEEAGKLKELYGIKHHYLEQLLEQPL